MKKANLLAVLLLLLPLRLQLQNENGLFIWAVGQGSWATWASHNLCLHFDMGGEKASWTRVSRICKGRKNILFLSHSDRDHISFAGQFIKKVGELCLARLPLDEARSAKSRAILNQLSLCTELPSFANVKEVLNPGAVHFKTSNDQSRIFALSGTFLFPGDASKKTERLWAKNVPPTITTLILSHHGSKSSNSENLFGNLPLLKTAIASSRSKVYGHPHEEVVARLKFKGVPVIRTEDWGTIKFL